MVLLCNCIQASVVDAKPQTASWFLREQDGQVLSQHQQLIAAHIV